MLGNWVFELVSVLLDHAAGDDDLRVFFSSLQKESRSYRTILARGGQKAAGVDDEIIGLFDSVGHFIAGFQQDAEHHLAVDEVARAAETDKMDFIAGIL